jgi:hypothetical protein
LSHLTNQQASTGAPNLSSLEGASEEQQLLSYINNKIEGIQINLYIYLLDY